MLGALSLASCINNYDSDESESENYEMSNDISYDSNYKTPNEDTNSCNDKFTYHVVVFNNKEYIIALPIICDPAPYIEKGMPGELNNESPQNIINPSEFHTQKSYKSIE